MDVENASIRFHGAILLDVPWQGCLAEAQELAWGGCKLGFLQICWPECPKASQLPPGMHAVQCHPSAMTAGLRSLLLRMELPASQVAVCGTPALHCAASRLGMHTFDTTLFVKVAWIVAGSHRSPECPVVGVAMGTHRWRDFLQRGFFPCVPCSSVVFARVQRPFTTSQSSAFDILLHKASDFLDGIDEEGRAIVAEDLMSLLQYADARPGHPVCLNGHFDLSKVVNRERMYAALSVHGKSLGPHPGMGTPPFFKVHAGERMHAVWTMARERDMSPPLLLKPLPACCLPGAHDFVLIESQADSADIAQDSIVQQFIPHKSIVHKVFVVGCQVHVNEQDSTYHLMKHRAPQVATGNRSASSFEHDVAAAVKEVFGMEIFGFDYLVDDTTGLFNIVDVNHLPSLKFPGAQQALWTLCTKAHKAGCRAKGYAASHMHVQ
ncbi:hypothetical protein CVIRNUC_002975 [Coccomyxa viridis]|uniref:inositol-1,3,4-trisphosphate 5/6-kinase n=1 Tax=Coccomyxa viridis TaxID=1274662 RepID=A0AAV1HZY6_9CHLO|nr:hypothetical protein CVIRNUC_002975 [Coccomyxa viridis]